MHHSSLLAIPAPWLCSAQCNRLGSVSGDGGLAPRGYTALLYAASHWWYCRAINCLHSRNLCVLAGRVDMMCTVPFSRAHFQRVFEHWLLIWQKLSSFSSAASKARFLPKLCCQVELCITPAWVWQMCTSKSMQCGRGLDRAFWTVNGERRKNVYYSVEKFYWLYPGNDISWSNFMFPF